MSENFIVGYAFGIFLATIYLKIAGWVGNPTAEAWINPEVDFEQIK